MDQDEEMPDAQTNEDGDARPENETNAASSKPKRVYIPGVSRPIKDSEEWDFDRSAYKMFHAFTLENSCLSLDIVPDKLGDQRTDFPLECTIATGTQASREKSNIFAIINLKRILALDPDEETSSSEDEDDEESESEDEKEDKNARVPKPLLGVAKFKHPGGVNRVRVAPEGNLCATWSDQGTVNMWNLSPAFAALRTLSGKVSSIFLKEKPFYSFVGHQCEGFAMDWCKTNRAKFASGDIKRNIHIWHMREGGLFDVEQRALNAHRSSVEDLQWSPTEDDILASCSSDKSIRLWDTRATSAEACVCTVTAAHTSDVNVISWNEKDTLLLSGGDDGVLKVWDLKFISKGQPVAQFKHHTAPITSIHWNSNDSSVFAASGEDDHISIWDLSVEPDDETETMSENQQEQINKVPPQLLFTHHGQEELKEIRWHPQLPGVLISTALYGFNIFRTISV